MNFNDIVNKGKELAGSKGAQEAYKEFNSTDGSYTDKAKAAYSGYQKGEKSGSEEKSDSKEEKTESSDAKK